MLQADEDLRQILYYSALKGRLFDLSLHVFANFPVQKYMLSMKSNELVRTYGTNLKKCYKTMKMLELSLLVVDLNEFTKIVTFKKILI